MINKKNIIEIKALDSLHGIIPEPTPAKKLIPDWYKSMKAELTQVDLLNSPTSRPKPYITQSLKACPPIQDYLCTGYVLSTITDIWMANILEEGADSPRYIGLPSLDFNYVEMHTPQQVKGSNLENSDIYKLVSPWMIKTPPGYSCLFLKPYFLDTKGIDIIPAVVDTDVFHNVNFPFTYRPTGEEVIPMNTPVVHVIPFKREAWKGDFSEVKEKVFAKDRLIPSLKLKNIYKKLRQGHKRDFT